MYKHECLCTLSSEFIFRRNVNCNVKFMWKYLNNAVLYIYLNKQIYNFNIKQVNIYKTILCNFIIEL